MKKILSCLLIIATIFYFPFSVSASEIFENAEYIYFEDGSYIKSVISQDDSGISLYSSSRTGSKTSTYYNEDGEELWYVKVTGTFTYGNGTSTCTSSSITAESYNSAWKLSDTSATKSGNTATASATAKKYLAFLVVKTINESVSLTCSSTGVLS